jgi:hypothetical protein
MWTASFWKQAAERAVKTFAQSILALITAGGMGVLDVDWGQVFSVGALATLASVLTSIVTAGVGEKNSPSAVSVE